VYRYSFNHCASTTTPTTSTETFNHAAELIEQADALIVAAGAGMGVDSGLPDFRGNEGFWKAYPALAKAQMSFTEVASTRTFQSDPRLAWGFYGHRLDLYGNTASHEGFAILQRWAQRMPHGAFVFTSNVDGQFQKAGFPADRVHEYHGSIHSVQRLKPRNRDIWSTASLTAHSVDFRNSSCKLQELQLTDRTTG
jgi:NAD-dependent SIR2 family protein deacetylase